MELTSGGVAGVVAAMCSVGETNFPRYRGLLGEQGGSVAAAFGVAVGECLRRFMRQNARAPLPEALVEGFGWQLWRVVERVGWPQPLGPDEKGAPGEMEAGRVEELVQEVLAELPHAERHAEMAGAARQLLKACLYPEFRQCRESYREVAEGVCRRQELTRTRGRISGAHCVDCPYWTSLDPAQHRALLEREWVGEKESCATYREIFLPEDFRRLRILVWGRSRERGVTATE